MVWYAVARCRRSCRSRLCWPIRSLAVNSRRCILILQAYKCDDIRKIPLAEVMYIPRKDPAASLPFYTMSGTKDQSLHLQSRVQPLCSQGWSLARSWCVEWCNPGLRIFKTSCTGVILRDVWAHTFDRGTSA